MAAAAAVEQLSTEAAHVACRLDLSLKIMAPVLAVASGNAAARTNNIEETEAAMFLVLMMMMVVVAVVRVSVLTSFAGGVETRTMI